MAKRPTRLRFTEDDLADSHVKKAADRADKAVDRAEKAADKLASKKAKPKLKLETDAAGSRKAKLRFEKAEFTEIERPSVAKHMASRGAAVTLTSKAHRAVSEYEDDNIGVQAVQETTKAVESTVYTVDHAVYSHKLKAYDKAEKLVEKSDKANVNALYEKFKKDNPDAGSNPFSRWQQKRAIKKEYAAAKAGKNTASTTASASKGAGKATGKAAQGAKNITERVTEFCTTHSKTILFVLIAGLLFMILSGMFSSCSAMFQGGTQIILGTSFTAKEEDIIGADNDYKALEAALRNKINNIERTHSGYDEYRYDLDEINHNPYELAAYLTVKFEDYTRDEVQATLQWLFEQQYELTLTEVVEIRTRTTSSTDPETGKTAKSILISCGARLAPFDIREVREITMYDELELDMVGDRKTALFFIISDTDATFNFLVSMAYTQLFNLLCERADDKYGGRLPVHVRCLIDEAANIGQIPNLEKLMATIRSREISACLVLQAQSQLKALYKDNMDTIIGNCDSSLFLGGKEETTLKSWSSLLGKETIDMYNTSVTKGNQESHGQNFQKLGKELMSVDELAVMDGGKCLLQVRGVRPFLSRKYDITKHPNYKYLSDYNEKNTFDIEKYLSTNLQVNPDEVFANYEISQKELAEEIA